MILFLHPVAKLLRAFLFYDVPPGANYTYGSVAMPSISGFSFLRYTSRTSVKSIAFSIVFAINLQNILKPFISCLFLDFPFFLLT